ncbi:hypothetical protein [Comamonas composti]|uniref:hypothetical protein n=1 Tax=Comamonas composti TaxID=408558 RepID=UPI00040F8792|nr:hypothetical protein [Comamonas composti]
MFYALWEPAKAWRILLSSAAMLVVAALLLPPLAQPAHYHDFADQRAWGWLPHALDVLSNLGFALAALAGLHVLGRSGVTQSAVVRGLAGVFFWGLVCSALCSALYHWSPDDARLMADRLGMSIAFAAMLGLAVQSRIGDAPAWGTAAGMLIAAVLAVLYWKASGNLLPWVLVQGGGMLAVLGLALLRRRAQGLALNLGAVIAWYALAKLFEWGDAAVFDLTSGLVSGHSLKHLLAAMAAWPVLAALNASRIRGCCIAAQ